MELKQVSKIEQPEYVTKSKINSKSLKKNIPSKWIKAGITGFVFSIIMKSKSVIAASSANEIENLGFMGIISTEPVFLPEPERSALLYDVGIVTFIITIILTIIYYIKKKKMIGKNKMLKVLIIILSIVGILLCSLGVMLEHF